MVKKLSKGRKSRLEFGMDDELGFILPIASGPLTQVEREEVHHRTETKTLTNRGMKEFGHLVDRLERDMMDIFDQGGDNIIVISNSSNSNVVSPSKNSDFIIILLDDFNVALLVFMTLVIILQITVFFFIWALGIPRHAQLVFSSSTPKMVRESSSSSSSTSSSLSSANSNKSKADKGESNDW